MKTRWLWLPLSLALLAQGARATVYHWKDAKGQDHYSQTPEPGRNNDVVPEKPGNAIAPSESAVDPATEAFLREADENEARARADKQKAATRGFAEAQQCGEAKSRLQFLEDHPPNRLATRDASGELTRMSSDEWDKRKAVEREEIAAVCKP